MIFSAGQSRACAVETHIRKMDPNISSHGWYDSSSAVSCHTPWNLKHVAPESRDGSHRIHGTAIFTYIWVIFIDECRCISKYIYIHINEIIYHTWILWGWKTINTFPFCVNRPIFKSDFSEKSPGTTSQRLSAEFFPGFHAQHWQKHLQVRNWQFHLREGFICGRGRI